MLRPELKIVQRHEPTENLRQITPVASFTSRLKDFFSLSLLDNRFPALHGLRLIAIFFVVISHNNSTLSFDEIVTNRRFWLGMDFFFIMSGFLIGNILLHESPHGWKYFLRFYVRRSFRVLPAYYFTLGLLIFRQFRVHGMDTFASRALGKEAFFLTNYPFAEKYFMYWSWSLSLEEHFYLTAPFLLGALFLIHRRFRIPALAVLFFIPFALRVFSVHSGEDFFIRIFTPTHFRFDPLIMGVLIAYLRKTYPLPLQRVMSNPIVEKAAFPLGVLLLLTMVFTFSMPLPGAEGNLANPMLASFYCGTLTSIAYGLLILWAVFSKSKWSAFLGSHPFRVVATLGYGVYLIHIPAIELVQRLGSMSWLSSLTIALILSALYAYVLHIFVEKPLFRLRERLTANKHL